MTPKSPSEMKIGDHVLIWTCDGFDWDGEITQMESTYMVLDNNILIMNDKIVAVQVDSLTP